MLCLPLLQCLLAYEPTVLSIKDDARGTVDETGVKIQRGKANTMRCFGVDIGNSGVRVSELLVDEQQLGDTVRLYWRFRDASLSASTKTDVPAKRFDPSDGRWTDGLESFLTQPDGYWLISSVRRDARECLVAAIEASNQNYRLLEYVDLPLVVDVDYPDRVGIDRLLAVHAAGRYLSNDRAGDASRSEAQRAIVIQAGSAVTVDLMERKAGQTRFLGGAIVPGMPLMLRLLGQATDLLPTLDRGDLVHMPELPGKNTEQAMLCGTSSALVGGVQNLVQRYRDAERIVMTGSEHVRLRGVDTGGNDGLQSELPVIISGGDGPRIAGFVPEPCVVIKDLVLEGLLGLASEMERN